MMLMLMRGLQLGKDRGQGRIDGQLGGFQFIMKGAGLRMQSLPFGFVAGTFALALESLELLLQVVVIRFEAGIGGEGCFMGRFQLCFFIRSENGMKAMVVVLPTG